MPDIDRTADVKVSAGREPVTAEIPLAGHASEHWLELLAMCEEFRARPPGGQRSGRPHVGHRHAAFRRSIPNAIRSSALDAASAFDRPGQRHGAEVAVSRRADRSCCPRLVGASATVAAIPPLALTCCLKGRFAQRVSLRVPQVSRCIRLSGSNRESPGVDRPIGTQRARACYRKHLIRRCPCSRPDPFRSVRDLGRSPCRLSAAVRGNGKPFIRVAPSVAPGWR